MGFEVVTLGEVAVLGEFSGERCGGAVLDHLGEAGEELVYEARGEILACAEGEAFFELVEDEDGHDYVAVVVDEVAAAAVEVLPHGFALLGKSDFGEVGGFDCRAEGHAELGVEGRGSVFVGETDIDGEIIGVA